MSKIFNYSQWPWGEDSDTLAEHYKEKKEWPRVTVIIPSFNQGAFIEETILSVIKQNYPNLELIIIDGGSKDNSVDIIKKYESSISYWVSEKDRGQSHAINKGLEKATGDWIAWLNSDDCYLKNAFQYLFVKGEMEEYDFVYGNYYMGESLTNSKEVQVMDSGKIDFSKVIRFFYGIDYIIPSQSVFFKRELLKKVGMVNEDLHYCMDVDWYARAFMLKPKVFKYKKGLCFFRFNANTKTGSFSNIDFKENKMGMEAEELALKYAGKLSFIKKMQFNCLYDYYLMYSKEPHKYEHCSLGYLLKLVMFHPMRSLSDRRILGLFKRKIF